MRLFMHIFQANIAEWRVCGHPNIIYFECSPPPDGKYFLYLSKCNDWFYSLRYELNQDIVLSKKGRRHTYYHLPRITDLPRLNFQLFVFGEEFYSHNASVFTATAATFLIGGRNRPGYYTANNNLVIFLYLKALFTLHLSLERVEGSHIFLIWRSPSQTLYVA